MRMEVFRRMRNTTRRATLDLRISILEDFCKKLRSSGYSKANVESMMEDGLIYYYRKVRIQLEGGEKLNRRSEKDVVQRKRAKLGAAERWFQRRRGGQDERNKKENGWRAKETVGPPEDRARTRTNKRNWRRNATTTENLQTTTTPGDGTQQEKVDPCGTDGGHKIVETTLMVPYTPGSSLRTKMQEAEDSFARLLRTRKVRVVESGGQKLVHMLGRNDP